MNREAASASRLAIQTNTAIVVYRDEKVVRITAAKLKAQFADDLELPPTPCTAAPAST